MCGKAGKPSYRKIRPGRYLTIDHWTPPDTYDNFRQTHTQDFHAMDQQGELLTTQETPLGTSLLTPVLCLLSFCLLYS